MKTYSLLCAALLLASACRPGAGPETAAAACIDPSKINPAGICTMDYNPVCGCDGKTYSNPCVARNAGVRTYVAGACAEAKPR